MEIKVMCDWVCLYLPRFQGRACAPGTAENSISILLCKEFGNNEGPDNSRFQFQLSLLQTMSRVYVLFSKKRPPPIHRAHPSHLTLDWRRNRQVLSAGKGTQQWITPSLPPLLFVHHLPLYPYPLSSHSFHHLPSFQSCGASGTPSPSLY